MDSAAPPEALSPPVSTAANGDPRRVGIEVEFLGIGARRAAEALARDLGGTPEEEDPHAFRLRGTRLGTMRVESDLRWVHPQRHPGLPFRPSAGAAAWLGTLAAPVVPRELILDPLPIARLAEVDGVVATLRAAGARGRGAVLLDGLGLHFNIDPPDLGARTVTAFLKAFLLASGDLRAATARGSRRLALTLPPDYPEAYRRLVLAPDYWPGIDRLTADYLAANPTRKRALDLLPLLTHLDPERVRAALPREKIGSRPVLHYRLPLVHLSDPAWSILPDWERWLAVERLAGDPGRLGAAGAAA